MTSSKSMASLTELCSICFTNPPKYTCPRCGCQTCSVACVKIHKKRAACSGVRNPASYLKSSELATPASIDRDYNFITKVQRDIEKAEDDIADRGITFVARDTTETPMLANRNWKLNTRHAASLSSRPLSVSQEASRTKPIGTNGTIA